MGGPNVNDGYNLVTSPEIVHIASDYEKTFRVLRSVNDIFLGAHGDYYDMESKYRHIGKGTNPFIDPAGYKNYVYDRERAFLAELQRQKSNGR